MVELVKYRHCTNLRVPFDRSDLSLLAVLTDYRFGDPVPAKSEAALSIEQLRARGIVGLYTTMEVLSDPLVKRATGWLEPEKVLGPEWKE